jgi:threonine synthase
VQSKHCAPIYEAWSGGLEDIPAVEKRPTAAEGISVAGPIRGKHILQAIRGSDGQAVMVGDDAVWSSLTSLAGAGFYAEPTSAAATAGLDILRARGDIREHERVVAVLTGSGLKATDKIVDHYGR